MTFVIRHRHHKSSASERGNAASVAERGNAASVAERGNAVWLILIVIALVGALFYALTKDSRGSQNILSDGQARLVATEIIEYGNSLRPIIDKMLLLNGISDTDSPVGAGILFDVPGAAIAPATRELFDPSGGNAPYMYPSAQACLSTCAYVFSGQVTVTGVGSGNPELTMLLVNIPQQVCQKVNVVLGLGTAISTGSPLTVVTPFNGTNYGAATAVTLAGGNHAFCYQESGGGNRYIYVNVIRAR